MPNDFPKLLFLQKVNSVKFLINFCWDISFLSYIYEQLYLKDKVEFWLRQAVDSILQSGPREKKQMLHQRTLAFKYYKILRPEKLLWDVFKVSESSKMPETLCWDSNGPVKGALCWELCTLIFAKWAHAGCQAKQTSCYPCVPSSSRDRAPASSAGFLSSVSVRGSQPTGAGWMSHPKKVHP